MSKSRSDTPWHHQEAKNVHYFYVREDVDTAQILQVLKSAISNHGLTVYKYDPAAGVIEMNGGTDKLKFPAVIKSGRHPIKGNMIILEWQRFDTEKAKRVAAGVMVALVVVAAVVLVAAVAEGSSNHGGGHSHHCSGGGSTFVYIDNSGSSSRSSYRSSPSRAIQAPARAACSDFASVDYSAVNMTAVPLAESRIEELRQDVQRYSLPVPSCTAFDSRQEFFDVFTRRLAVLLYNHGLARVPSYDDQLKITPVELNPSPVRTATLPPSRTHVFYFDVKPEMARSALTALQFELLSSGKTRMAARLDALPNWWKSSTITATETGQNSSMIQLAQPKPGRYYLSITNASSSRPASYTLAAAWFDKSNDMQRDDSLLAGNVRFDASASASAGADKDDDDWELVDVDAGAAGIPLTLAELRGCDPVTAANGKLYQVTQVQLEEEAAAARAAQDQSTPMTMAPSDDSPPAYAPAPETVQPSAPLPTYNEAVAHGMHKA